MSQCKAVKADGEQCKREARDGLEYCAIPAHAAQEQAFVPEAVQPKTENQYGMAILSVGEVSAPDIGGYSGKGVISILQDYHDRGFELFSVESGGELELANNLKYIRMIYTFKRRDD